MLAACSTRYGSPDVITIDEVQRPMPGPTEVLVRVVSASVTAADWRVRAANPFLVRLFFGLRRPKLSILGGDFAGIVEAVGDRVSSWTVGDRVCGNTDLKFGAHAEYLIQREDRCMAPLPDGIPWDQGGVLASGGLTALYFLRDIANIKAENSICIIGAGGSVGSAAVQLAKHFGASVTAIASSSRKDVMAELGVDRFIDYTATDYSTIDERFDIVFDAAGVVPFGRCKRLLTPTGRYITTAFRPALPLANLAGKLRGDGRRASSGTADYANKAEDLRLLVDLMERGALKPVIERSYDLTEISKAHSHAESGHKLGNLAVNIGSSGVSV